MIDNDLLFDQAVVVFSGDANEPKATYAENVIVSPLGASGTALGGTDEGKRFFVPMWRLRLITEGSPPA